jgi:hypothetical protein
MHSVRASRPSEKIISVIKRIIHIVCTRITREIKQKYDSFRDGESNPDHHGDSVVY